MPTPAFKLTAPKLSENDVEAQVKTLLEFRGWRAIRQHVGKFVPLSNALNAIEVGARNGADAGRKALFNRTSAGIITIGEESDPDWLFIHPRFPPMFIEVKAPGKHPNYGQLARLLYLQKLGFFACAVDNIDIFRGWYENNVAPKEVL